MTIANAITLMRIVLVPVFVYFFATGAVAEAFAAFLIAGASDLIDGTVARVMKQRSAAGALLDPMADKLLLESAFVCLVFVGILPLWFFLFALARDLMIVAGIVYFKINHIPFPSRAIWSSKLATLTQMLTIIIGLIMMWRPSFAVGAVGLSAFLPWVMFAASALIVISGALYVRIGIGVLKARNNVTIWRGASGRS